MSGNIFRKMTSNTFARAIVIGHGSFAEGLVSAVDSITGRGDVFIALSNHGLSGVDLETRLRDSVDTSGVKVLFTDLPAGSATMAARRVLRDHPHCVLVTGTNLAALLDFAFQSDLNPAESARLAVEKGRLALVVSEPAK